MFFIWWDDLMDISGMHRTARLRLYFSIKYGHEAYRSWMGLNRVGEDKF